MIYCICICIQNLKKTCVPMSTHESYTASVLDSRRRFLAQVPTGATRPGKCDNVSGFGADSRGGWGDFPLTNGTAGIRVMGDIRPML